MRRVVRNRLTWTALTVWLLFWPIAWALERDTLFDLVNALSVSVGVGVLCAYMPGFWYALRHQPLSGPHYLVLGIGCTWLATSIRHMWNWGWRFLDKPEWMIDHPFVAFLVWVLFTGGCLHLTAKGAIDGDIPKSNWIWLGAVVAVAVFLTLVAAFFLGPTKEFFQGRGGFPPMIDPLTP